MNTASANRGTLPATVCLPRSSTADTRSPCHSSWRCSFPNWMEFWTAEPTAHFQVPASTTLHRGESRQHFYQQQHSGIASPAL